MIFEFKIPKHSQVMMLLLDQTLSGTFSGQLAVLEPKTDPEFVPRFDIDPMTQNPWKP